MYRATHLPRTVAYWKFPIFPIFVFLPFHFHTVAMLRRRMHTHIHVDAVRHTQTHTHTQSRAYKHLYAQSVRWILVDFYWFNYVLIFTINFFGERLQRPCFTMNEANEDDAECKLIL